VLSAISTSLALLEAIKRTHVLFSAIAVDILHIYILQDEFSTPSKNQFLLKYSLGPYRVAKIAFQKRELLKHARLAFPTCCYP
jgi:hypothetical protein